MFSFCYSDDPLRKQRARQLAIQQVQDKFPHLPVNSSGWLRAVENRFKRNCRF